MTRLLTFASFFVFALYSCTPNTQKSQSGIQNIEQEDVAKILNQENAILMDVRSPQETEQGFIKGTSLFVNVNGEDFAEQIEKLDKTRTYIVYCQSGARSHHASSYMLEHGFSKIYNLTGGYGNWNGETAKP